MIFSYNWLQRYFNNQLPKPEELADLITFSAFEIESLEQKNKDYLIDIKVLPDRAHYALSHRGIAREISAALQVETIETDKISVDENTEIIKVSVENFADCSRYMARKVSNVSVEDISNSDESQLLLSIGQRPINNIVDLANFVMFDMGQPLHAFDADKVKGGISIRRAKKGESMTTLDNKVIQLDESILIIADDDGPLAIAGIKGGKKAEVTIETKNLILESANFNPQLIRKTSEKIGIRTDASKRFENAPTASFTEIGLREFSLLINKYCPAASFGKTTDHNNGEFKSWIIEIRASEIIAMLGMHLTENQIGDIFNRLHIGFELSDGLFRLEIPPERLDLQSREDIAEEIGRLMGYGNIKEVLPKKVALVVEVNKRLYWESKIREFLKNRGFIEIMTSSFSDKGEIAVLRPLASDKSMLRTSLSQNMDKALSLNMSNLVFLGLNCVKLFEIGKIFKDDQEILSLCIGIRSAKSNRKFKANEEIKVIRDLLVNELGDVLKTTCTLDDSGGIIVLDNKAVGEINKHEGILELDLGILIDKLGAGSESTIPVFKLLSNKYKEFSIYPFISRDIALFVPETIKRETVGAAIIDLLSVEAKKLLVKSYFFDEYRKEGRVSYAFRLIFQSFDRTLTDVEVNSFMDSVYEGLKKKTGWEIR